MDTENNETTFQYLKRCMMKQKRMFVLIRDIIQVTSDIKKVYPKNQNDTDTFLKSNRPFKNRFDFKPDEKRLPNDLSFESLSFFRAYYNPEFEGFSSISLHQYHILFNMLEHEMVLTETEIQGINLKFVLFSSITSANMMTFLNQMHGIDMVPISHPNGYRQVLF